MTLHDTLSQLELARSLDLPSREAMLRRDRSVQVFWADNRELLVDAWTEWGAERGADIVLDDSLIHPPLRDAVTAAWADPSTESTVADLIDEPAPGVFSFQFFDPERLADLRGELEAMWDAGIPMRPPYGIVLNRKGAMLDLRSDGSLAAPSFQAFYRLLMDTYMRPISRLLFPEITGYDAQTFGFSINDRPETDTSIRPHTDASSVTLNLNVNVPGEEFTGSTVDFLDPASNRVTPLSFEPGTAMLHRGTVPHTAQPNTSGERTNLVLWLFGESGNIPPGWVDGADVDARTRWSTLTEPQGMYTPF